MVAAAKRVPKAPTVGSSEQPDRAPSPTGEERGHAQINEVLSFDAHSLLKRVGVQKLTFYIRLSVRLRGYALVRVRLRRVFLYGSFRGWRGDAVARLSGTSLRRRVLG